MKTWYNFDGDGMRDCAPVSGTKVFDVGAYIRLSDEDGDKRESDSITTQRQLLKEYVETHPDLRLCECYVDDGYSGTNFNRPAFRRMMADIHAGKITCVIVKDLSRFGRDYIDTGRYLERIFPNMGIRFIAINDGIDSFKRSYDMLLPIKNIFNEQYARDISQKIQASIGAKQRSGQFIGAFACYGYKKSPINKNQLIIDPCAADVVRRIFHLFLQGYGKQEIAKLLNREGVLSPTEYKKSNGENYQNKNRLPTTTYWSYTTINHILHHEGYIGNMVQRTKHQTMRGKQTAVPREEWIVVQATHDAIIDQATWEQTQMLLQQKTGKMQVASSANVFAGFVKCGDCGRAMMKHTWRLANGTKAVTLNCGTYRRNGAHYCSAHTIPLGVLETIILQDVRTILCHTDHIQVLVDRQRERTERSEPLAQQDIVRLTDALSRIRRLKKSVYEDYKDGLLEKDEFLSYRQEYAAQEALYSKQYEALKRRANARAEAMTAPNPWIRQLLEQREIQALDRAMIVEMIKEIQIFEHHRIVIRYRFSDELERCFANTFVADSQRSFD